MKKLIFILLPLLYINVSTIAAQETNGGVISDTIVNSVTMINCIVKKDWEVKRYFESGELKFSGFCKKGKQIGRGNNYYRSCKIASTSSFKNGLPDGYIDTFYENGQLASKISINSSFYFDKVDMALSINSSTVLKLFIE